MYPLVVACHSSCLLHLLLVFISCTEVHRYRDVVCASVMFVCPYPAAKLPVPVPSSWPALASASVAFKGGPCTEISFYFSLPRKIMWSIAWCLHTAARRLLEIFHCDGKIYLLWWCRISLSQLLRPILSQLCCLTLDPAESTMPMLCEKIFLCADRVDCRSRWQDLCGRVHITGEANTWRSGWACCLLFVYVSSKMWPAEEHHWVQPRDLSIGGAAGGWRRKVVQFPSPPSQAKKIFCLLRARAPSPLCFVVDGNENSSNFNLLPKE